MPRQVLIQFDEADTPAPAQKSKSKHPRDPNPGREEEKYTSKSKLDSEWEDTDMGMKGGSTSTSSSWTDTTDDGDDETEQACMCGPRKELERYFNKEELVPVGFKVHVTESEMQRIPYFAKILAAYPTKSLNGRIYDAEVLSDATRPYIGKPFILDHIYDDSFKVHGQIVDGRYGTDISEFDGQEYTGMWLNAIGLMPAELVPLIQGDREHRVPPLVRGVSIGGEGDADPTTSGMKLKKFYPTELSMTPFPGIPNAHIAAFSTITESAKKATRKTGRSMYRPRGNEVWVESMPGGNPIVHVPDVVGQGHARGSNMGATPGRLSMEPAPNLLSAEDERRILAGQQVRGKNLPPSMRNYTGEGPQIGSADAFRRPENRQVPFAPGFPSNPPSPGFTDYPGVPSPGFSSDIPRTGWDMRTNSIPDQDWQNTPESVKRYLTQARANPGPIQDADKKGAGEEEEEEEERRHQYMIQQIRAKQGREMGPVASDGGQVSGIAAKHKHLPSDGKPTYGKSAGRDTKHTSQGAKAAGEAKVDVGPDDDEEEEEEERVQGHSGIKCSQAHGLMPHNTWMRWIKYNNKEGTEPFGPEGQFRGPPRMDLPNMDARSAAAKVGTTTSESIRQTTKVLEQMRPAREEAKPGEEEEEEEEEEERRHQAALQQIRQEKTGRALQQREGTAQPPAQGRGVPLPGMRKGEEEEEEERRRLEGVPVNPIVRAGHMLGLQRQVQDLGSGVPAVTVNSLPTEYTQRLNIMTEKFRSMIPSHPGNARGASRESYPNPAPIYQDPNRMQTVSTFGMPANVSPQSLIVRSAGNINEIVQTAWQDSAQYSDQRQDRVKHAWNQSFNQYMEGLKRTGAFGGR